MTEVLLLASPLVGPATWAPVAAVLQAAGRTVHVADPRTPPSLERPLLVAHSNAGFFTPALAAAQRAVATVYVDAALAGPGPDTSPAPAGLMAHLRAIADYDGVLPPWTQWWPEESLAGLFPDDATRRAVERGQPRLPLAYFEQRVPVPVGWEQRPAAYLAFGETYAEETARARALGWPVEILDGGHLHLLRDPDAVASAIERLATGAAP